MHKPQAALLIQYVGKKKCERLTVWNAVAAQRMKYHSD